ncbi:MAG: DNA translocase FtsK 4TM domain-containing protein, partial [Proteobacteria bacterium]|nr:DNA translocase FtsK 4TM domain-containing protein [Pseudomonadota bacterium]
MRRLPESVREKKKRFSQGKNKSKDRLYLFLVSLAIFYYIAIFSYHEDDPSFYTAVSPDTLTRSNLGGTLGAELSAHVFSLFGYVAYILPVLLVFLLVKYGKKPRMKSENLPTRLRELSLVKFVMLAGHGHIVLSTLCLWLSLISPVHSLSGGWLGYYTKSFAFKMLGIPGAWLLLITVTVIYISAQFKLPLVHLITTTIHKLLSLKWLHYCWYHISAFTTRVGWSLLKISSLMTLVMWPIRFLLSLILGSIKRFSHLVSFDFTKIKTQESQKLALWWQQFRWNIKKQNTPALSQGVVSETGSLLSSSFSGANLGRRSEVGVIPLQNHPHREETRKIPVTFHELDQGQKKKSPMLPTPFDTKTHKPLHLLKYLSQRIKKNHQSRNISQTQPHDHSGRNMGETLEKTLGDFHIYGKLHGYNTGPRLRTYEFEPDSGIKQTKLTSLADDIARALKVDSVLIQPIPGKSSMGIQVPRKDPHIIYLFDELGDLRKSQKISLPVALGVTPSGDWVHVDLASMPHLLMAGATGSGKSVGIHTLINSLICSLSPQDVRLILVDPKMLELSTYNHLPHLAAPVITDPSQACQSLQWAVAEMERRYRLMQDFEVRHMEDFNKAWQELSLQSKQEWLEKYPDAS